MRDSAGSGMTENEYSTPEGSAQGWVREPPPPNPRRNRLAIAALCVSFLPQVVVSAVIAVVALVQIRRRRERGRALAVTALILSVGWLAIIAVVAAVVVVVQLYRIDDNGLERKILADAQRDFPFASIGSVDCPSGRRWEKGSVFVCASTVGTEKLTYAVTAGPSFRQLSWKPAEAVVDITAVKADVGAKLSTSTKVEVSVTCDPSAPVAVRPIGGTISCRATGPYNSATAITVTVKSLAGVVDWSASSVAALTAGGDIGTEDLKVGTCVLEPKGTTFSRLRALPCERPHDYEVYSVIQPPGTTYPGTASVERYAQSKCLAAFPSYVGSPYAKSSYDFGYFIPTARSWAADSREIACYLFNPGGQKLTKPLRSAEDTAAAEPTAYRVQAQSLRVG
jgi:hypothetical protein